MKIIENKITLSELATIAEEGFGDFVKAVVDIEKGSMVIGGELHADEESLLLANGSKQENLWGINIYPENTVDTRIEFDSMINIRPKTGNRSRGVDDVTTQTKIIKIVNDLIIS